MLSERYEEVLHERFLSGYYFVSQDGTVMKRIKNGYIPAGYKTPNGYMRIGIYVNGRLLRTMVHRLVWRVFNGPIPHGMEINHKDGNKLNNNIENLEVVTLRDNMRHSHFVLGRNLVFGSRVHTAKLTEYDIPIIRSFPKRKYRTKFLAESYGVSTTLIKMITAKKIWRHIE